MIMNKFPNVATVLPPKNEIPQGFHLMVHKWSFPEERSRIIETVQVGGESVKKLLTLDLNVPRANFAEQVNDAPLAKAREVFVKNYPCIHKCPGCFNEAEVHNPLLTMREMWHIVDQAQELGLESVKFLGPGELTINPDLFTILDEFARRNIVVGIFTKAAILGNDEISRRYHGISSDELVRRMTAYPNTTFLVGGRSFDPVLENRYIPRNPREIDIVFDYAEARNAAVEKLCAAGMNADLLKQRMAIMCNPVTTENLGGVAEIYKWSAERNIPAYLPPTMVSGKGHALEQKASEQKFEDDYINMAVEVYTWAIERGIMTLEQFKHEKAHPYVGVTPCNQLTHGLYVHYDGAVWRCPGNDTPDFVVHENIRKGSLLEIWKESRNYGINAFNNKCVKDGYSLPRRFYTEVMARVTGQ
ncbi:MAG: hypothetical protein PHV42_01460 [Candidatus Pacebacteria bacterium]|nr:hypothetical protein [Candidatus Paceibacterota bacterium]